MSVTTEAQKMQEASEFNRAIWRVQTIVLKAVHDFFYERKFEQLMPVILSPITDPLGPDPGSSVVTTGEISYLGQSLQLTQSMILHKQIAVGKGVDKLYIVSPNIRLESPEKAKTGVHAFEFSQVDFEVRDATMKDIFKLLEDVFRYIHSRVTAEGEEELKVLGRELPSWDEPFPVYTTHELEEKYGADWERLASLDHSVPFFVTCHKREFYDKLDRSREGEHYLNYDLYYPEGFLEALSGAEREFEYKHLVERIERDGFPLEKYHGYLERAKEGKIPPTAGGGFGVERMVRYFTGRPHISEVQFFPRVPGEKILL